MKRCKKTHHAVPAYPHVKAFVKRHGRRAGVGLVVGVVATSAGCDWFTVGTLGPKPEVDTGEHIDGMIAETAETWTLELPLDGPRDLYFTEPWGWIQYRLQLIIDGTPLYDWLYQNADQAVAVVDEVLSQEDVTAYEHDDGFDVVEDRIVTALMRAYAEAGGGSGSFNAVDLSILAYEDEDDILGDMEFAR